MQLFNTRHGSMSIGRNPDHVADHFHCGFSLFNEKFYRHFMANIGWLSVHLFMHTKKGRRHFSRGAK